MTTATITPAPAQPARVRPADARRMDQDPLGPVDRKAPVSLSDPGVLRAVVGGGLYLAMVGLFALALGGIIRHTAAGITGVIGFVLVLAPLASSCRAASASISTPTCRPRPAT